VTTYIANHKQAKDERKMSTYTESHVGRTSKLERYSWKELDQKGTFADLSKDLLLVDPDYQRDALEEKVLRLAREWSWCAAGAVLVAKRLDGRLYVFDGQYRVLAARKRSDIKTLPAIVYEMPNLKDEALAFLRSNCNRKSVMASEKFRAQLITDDETAHFIQRLVDAAGRRISFGSSGPTTLTCVATMQRAARSNRDSLMSVWPLIIEVCDGKPMHEKVIESLFYIERNLPEGQSLQSAPWRGRVIKLGASGILRACNEAGAYYQRGGAKVWASGVIRALNKGCRIHIAVANAES
jgi:hypothetical protein